MDDSLQSQIDEANRLLGERKYDEIIALVQPILIRETDGQAQRVYGMALLGQGKYQEAVHLLMTAAQLLPNDATVAFAYGNAMNLNGQTEGARASFERALGLDPNHPGAKMGYLNTSKALADRDQPESPMKAIEWLYGAWQRDMGNAELAMRIFNIYVENGWGDSARQFAELLPPQLKNSDTMRARLKELPAEAPPVSAAAGPAMAPAASSVFEACPFCKQQIMAGVHTCPHCKMVIRSKAMPGADYKPEWQEVVLNILCWIGMLIAAFQGIMVFVEGSQATPGGGFTLVIAFVQVLACIFILQRNDFWMSISKWLYVISCIRCMFCACLAFGFVGDATGKAREAGLIVLIEIFVTGLFSAFMVYLLNYEGAD
ncbi:MAG: tetratricopeptide repeat protein [Armatimonadetes bacterium]|nr:tetratricopeptide repeat protein [Armatimonadota bacterium]MBS1725429.1 tetratricopeptide repeat protein [Armatimonadota bacterium]